MDIKSDAILDTDGMSAVYNRAAGLSGILLIPTMLALSSTGFAENPFSPVCVLQKNCMEEKASQTFTAGISLSELFGEYSGFFLARIEFPKQSACKTVLSSDFSDTGAVL